MRFIERWLFKIMIIQFIILILVQLVLHKWHAFPELHPITHYEGVTNNSHMELLETFSQK